MKLTKEQHQEILDQQSQKNTTKRVTSPELENKTFKNIVEHCFTKSGNIGETIAIHDKVFNAGSFIPKASFYNYRAGSKSGIEHCRSQLENEGRKGNCSENEEVVVYHKDDGYLQISEDTFRKLSKTNR